VGTPGQIVAFSPSSDGTGNDATEVVNVTFEEEAPSLEGPTWVLDGTIPGTEITAKFDNGQVTGSAGCNGYNGPYFTTPAASGGRLTISDLLPTMMVCEEAIMDQETRYLSVLMAASEYSIQDNELTIQYPGGRLVYYSQ
jgi:heat shock protein HslJ